MVASPTRIAPPDQLISSDETTANTLTFAFLELAKYPEIQKKLREEIRATRAAARARGQTDLKHSDYEGMAYLNAFIKVRRTHPQIPGTNLVLIYCSWEQEVLRFHPVSYNNFRQAVKDDVLPLFNPITTVSGKVLTEVAIPKGTKLVISIAACNRYAFAHTPPSPRC